MEYSAFSMIPQCCEAEWLPQEQNLCKQFAVVWLLVFQRDSDSVSTRCATSALFLAFLTDMRTAIQATMSATMSLM